MRDKVIMKFVIVGVRDGGVIFHSQLNGHPKKPSTDGTSNSKRETRSGR